MASSKTPVVINGNTAAPAAATYRGIHPTRLRGGAGFVGILAAGVPAAIGAVVTALQRFGTMRFPDIAGFAIHYARTGFPAHVGLLEAQEGYGIRDCAEFFSREWPHSAALYLPSGKVPQTAQVLRNSPYADFLELLMHRRRQRGRRPRRKAGRRL